MVYILFVFFSYNSFLKININTISEHNSFWAVLFYLNNSYNNVLIIFTVISLYTFLKNKKLHHLWLVLLFISTQYNYNNNFFLFESSINKDLYNGLLITHPILTYTGGIIFYNCMQYTGKIIKLNNLKYSLIVTLIITIFTTLLGSLWAQQELNWGGWWNWDAVEIILLCTTVVTAVYIHVFSKNKFLLVSKINYLNKFVYVFIFYFVVRSNFVNSVHSFSISLQLQKYFYVVFYLIMFVVLYYYNITSEKRFLEIKSYFYRKKINLQINTHYYFLLISSIILFVTVVNMFFFFFNEKINTNTYKYLAVFIKISFFYFLVYRYLKYRYTITLLIVFIITNCNLFTPLLIIIYLLLNDVFFSNKNIKNIHVIFFIILYYFLEFLDFTNSFLTDNYFFKEKLDCLLLFNNNKIFLSEHKQIFAQQYLYFYNFYIKFAEQLDSIDNVFKQGFDHFFFNSNIIQYFNKTTINYVIDGSSVVKLDLFVSVVIMFIFLLVLLLFREGCFIRKYLFFKNGIV